MSVVLPVFFIVCISLFFIPKKFQFYVTLATDLILIAFSGYYAILSFNTVEPLQFSFAHFYGAEIFLVIDRISAFFILVVNLIILAGILYSKGYLAPYISKKNKTEFGLHHFSLMLLHLSMLFVLTLREGISFLIAWEVMSVATFFLVIFESEIQGTIKAGIQFIIQMHIAFVFIIVAFLVA